jgi:hypothetical protein
VLKVPGTPDIRLPQDSTLALSHREEFCSDLKSSVFVLLLQLADNSTAVKMFLSAPLLLIFSIFNLANAQTASFDIASALSAA